MGNVRLQLLNPVPGQDRGQGLVHMQGPLLPKTRHFDKNNCAAPGLTDRRVELLRATLSTSGKLSHRPMCLREVGLVVYTQKGG